MKTVSLHPVSDGASASRQPAVGWDATASLEELQAAAYVELFRDPTRSADWALRAQTAARRAGVPLIEAYATTTLALAQLLGGSGAAGAEALQLADALARCVSEPRLEWLVSDARALALFHQSRFDEALVELIRLMLATLDHRPLWDCYLSITSLAQIHAALGHSDEAIGAGYRALTIARRTRSSSLRVHAVTTLGLLHLQHEHLAGARTLLEQGLFGAVQVCSDRIRRQAANGLVRTYLAEGSPGPALDVARRHLSDEAALADRWVLAAALTDNRFFADAAVCLKSCEASGFPPPDRLTWTALRGRLALAEGRPARALALCREVDDDCATSRSALDVVRTLQLASDAVGEGDRARAYGSRADRILAALTARGAATQSLCDPFEQDPAQAQPVFAGTAPLLDG